MILWVIIILIIIAIVFGQKRSKLEIFLSLIAIILLMINDITKNKSMIATDDNNKKLIDNIIHEVSTIPSSIKKVLEPEPFITSADVTQELSDTVDKQDTYLKSRISDIPQDSENSIVLGSMLRSESRGDNISAILNTRLQRRALENSVNQSRFNVRSAKDYYDRELDYNDTREWWAIDATEHPINRLV